ncbi:5912_t:CDS:1 [Dentiscutata erythropus]|uniref:5912_t:CDS:1 n=1 Tax=Dentiscutata erythropus TaxID=1348616 RepID=A0A9N9NPI9_9GLOM|nr:5912_t:CDS:1 [Dentiscutata erythropus]
MICLSKINPTFQHPIIILTCYHFFHAKCINRWASGSEYTCPICRNKDLENTSKSESTNQQVNPNESTTANTSTSIEYTPIEPTTVNTSTPMEYTPIEPTTVNTSTSIEYTQIESTTTNISTSIPSILIANPHDLTSTSDLAISTITSTNSSNPVSTIANPSSLAIPTIINSSNNSTSNFGNSTRFTLVTKPSSSTANLRKEKNFLEIFADLVTPSEISRVSSSEGEEVDSRNATISLVQLYNKAEHSQKRAILANHAEIWSWYRFAKAFER